MKSFFSAARRFFWTAFSVPPVQPPFHFDFKEFSNQIHIGFVEFFSPLHFEFVEAVADPNSVAPPQTDIHGKLRITFVEVHA